MHHIWRRIPSLESRWVINLFCDISERFLILKEIWNFIIMLTSCEMNKHFIVGAIFPPSCANEADSSWKWSYYFNGETKKVFEKLLDWSYYYFNKTSHLSVWWQKDQILVFLDLPTLYCVISEQDKQGPWCLNMLSPLFPNETHIHCRKMIHGISFTFLL